MRRGFTMIELIFVIVIIGILAAVAIPKLAATRDDAKISGEVASIRQVIDNLGAEYTSQATLTALSIAQANAATDCFTVALSAGSAVTDGNITVTNTATDPVSCPTPGIATPVYTMSAENGIVSAATAAATTIYEFGGSTVVR